MYKGVYLHSTLEILMYIFVVSFVITTVIIDHI